MRKPLNDVHAEKIRDARRMAVVKVALTIAGGLSLIVAGYLVALWVGFVTLGVALLWSTGVLHAPARRPRGDS